MFGVLQTAIFGLYEWTVYRNIEDIRVKFHNLIQLNHNLIPPLLEAVASSSFYTFFFVSQFPTYLHNSVEHSKR